MITNTFIKIVVLVIVLQIIYLYLQINKIVKFHANHKDIILIQKNIVKKINHAIIMININTYNIKINNNVYNNVDITFIKQIVNLYALMNVQINHIFTYKINNV